MMPQHDTQSRNAGRQMLIRTARAAALAALYVCACTAMARAGDDDPNATQSSGSSVYEKMLDVVGLGGQGTIQYSERSPLVVPPTRDLPPPVANAVPAVPNWPKDPDVERSKQTKVKEKPGPHPNWVIENSRPLSPDELRNPGGVAGGTSPGTPATPAARPSTADYPEQIERSKKSAFSLDWFKKEQYATFTGEPARTSLTDPPPGYQTPSPDQPYGIGPDRKQYKIPTVADRVTPTSGSAGGQ
jgi:hypothetical protein